jgi:hypothetical protein
MRLAMTCASGYPFRWHNRYLSDQQISQYFRTNKTDFYASIYSVDDEVCPSKYDREIVQELPLKGDLVIDIDAHSNIQKNNVRNIVKSALDTLRSFDAPYVLFSSGRGFHIHVLSNLHVQGLPTIHKALIGRHLDGADMCLYNQYRVIRYPNSINGKSETYKVPIHEDDLDLSDNVLRKKLLQPVEVPVLQPNPNFDEFMLDSYRDQVDTLKQHVSPFQGKSGTLKISNQSKLSFRTQKILKSCTIKIGTRHNTTFHLGIELKHLGYPEEITKELLISWGMNVRENGCSRSRIEEILIDTDQIIDWVYENETYWPKFDYMEKLMERYRKHVPNQKPLKRWEKTPNEMKTYCVFKAAGDLNPKFFLSYSMIRKVTRLQKLGTRKTNYVHSLIEKGYIERISPDNVPYFVPRNDSLQDTFCYQLLR